MALYLPGGHSQPVWFCPTNGGERFWRIPLSYNCSQLVPDVSTPLRALTIQLYRPNTKRYDSPASLCKIVEQTVFYSVNFFGARSESHAESYKTVSIEHCRLMVQHGRCEFGSLSKSGSVAKTSNPLEFEWPSAPFGCCIERKLTVVNCYLVSTTVHGRHGTAAPESPVGDMRHCAYKEGSCVLRDGSVMVWSPSHEESCQFLYLSKMKGQMLGNVWLSDSKEFALSWKPTNPSVVDCGRALTITDQGYAVTSMQRVSRSAPHSQSVGLVTSNQLAAQLLAVENAAQGAVVTIFRNALISLCDKINFLALSLHSALLVDPTFVVRTMLQRLDIAASYHGNGMLQIYRCISIPTPNYSLRPFNATCYAKPAVKVVLPSGTSLSLFLDPTTLVLAPTAIVADCSTSRFFLLPTSNGTVKFDAFTGSTALVAENDISPVTHPATNLSGVTAPPLTIFHNLVLTNISELIPEHQLTELWEARTQEHIFNALGMSHLHSSRPSDATSATVFKFDVFAWSIFDWWITVCCLYTSVTILRMLCITYVAIYYPEALSTLRSLGFYRPVTTPSRFAQTPTVRPSVSTSQPPPGIQLTRLELDSGSTWPPKASTSPVIINSLACSEDYFVAQIPVKVNEVHMLALVDTGAAITLTGSDMAPLLGIFSFQKSSVSRAIGVAGVPVELLGCAHIRFQVGNFEIWHLVHFADTKSVPKTVKSYNIILGNDFLSRLPNWNIDYAARKLRIGSTAINIMVLQPGSGRICEMANNDAVVRVAQTTVLRPGSESFVRCVTEGATSQSLMVVGQRQELWERSLIIVPSLVHSGSCRLLITNPTKRPEVLFKNQAVAVLTPVEVLEDDMQADSFPSKDSECSPAIVAATCEMGQDPLPPFDLSKASVADTEKHILLELFEEFRDRFSYSSYDLGSYQDTQINIKTTTNIPPGKFRPPRIPIKYQQELDQHINKLIQAGRIVESDTPWIHNTVLVKKKDGSLRVCLDFRPLNDVTIPDHFPLPRIEDLLSKIAGNKYYTTLDLASGYMQLALSPESQYKCGWATHKGVYQFQFLPFGLKNAGAYFCRVMARVLAGLESNCLAYIDDVVIFDRDFNSHVASLRKVFERFRTFNLKISHKKFTEIAQSKITFLGHEISSDCYSPAERNVSAIRDFPVPKSTKEVKGVVGMANFFRRFIPNFSLIAAPLYELSETKSSFRGARGRPRHSRN